MNVRTERQTDRQTETDKQTDRPTARTSCLCGARLGSPQPQALPNYITIRSRDYILNFKGVGVELATCWYYMFVENVINTYRGYHLHIVVNQ